MDNRYVIKLRVSIGNFKDSEGYASKEKTTEVQGIETKTVIMVNTPENTFCLKEAQRISKEYFPAEKGWDASIIPISDLNNGSA